MKFAAVLLASAVSHAVGELSGAEVAGIFCKTSMEEVVAAVAACPSTFSTIHTEATSGIVLGTTESQATVDACIADCNTALEIATCSDFDEEEKIDFVFTCMTSAETTTAAATTTPAAEELTTAGALTAAETSGTTNDDTTTSMDDTSTGTSMSGLTTAGAVRRRKLEIIRLSGSERAARRLEHHCNNGARVDNAQEIACVVVPTTTAAPGATTACPGGADICAGTTSVPSAIAAVAAVVVAWLVN